MKIALLGSGNVATHLGKALKLNGHEIIQVWSKTLTHALELGEILDSKYTDNLTDLTPDAELYIISVSDDAIKEVASRIALSNKIIVHTSGTTEIDIPGISGVFYPIQTFSKQKNVDFSKIPIAIEGRNSEITEVLYTQRPYQTGVRCFC